MRIAAAAQDGVERDERGERTGGIRPEAYARRHTPGAGACKAARVSCPTTRPAVAGPSRITRNTRIRGQFVLAFIDVIVIPFLTSLYSAVGYLGVFFAMVIESTLLPLPSELILPLAGFMVSDHTKLEPLTHGPWNFWVVVVIGVVANTTGSLCGYALGAKLGRPFLDRWGRFLLIRPHEVDQAEYFFARWGSPTAFFSRLLPGVRSVISFIAGVSHMPIGRFTFYSTLGAIPWTIALVYAGTVLGSNYTQIRETLRPFDTLILVLCIAAVVGFAWWRLGHPGWRRAEKEA
jgi:membrane protein DedA with SNARE-associated domain